jgi:hypothetical protein
MNGPFYAMHEDDDNIGNREFVFTWSLQIAWTSSSASH